MPHGGGATRHVSTGVNRTSSADRIKPAAPPCAAQPDVSASVDDNGATASKSIPASCATAISGIAAKFNTSPANVTREKYIAPIGISSASTAIDATSIVRII